jgi:hypothetical protein
MPTISITKPPLIHAIDLGTSTPKLSGTIDITSFISLTSFFCNDNAVVNFTDANPTVKTGLRFLSLNQNALASFPDTSDYTGLGYLFISNNAAALGAIPSNLPNGIVQLILSNSGLSGEIPHGNLPSIPGVAQFSVADNPLLTGSVLNSDFTKNLNGLTLSNCSFTGSIPSLRWGAFSQRLARFDANGNSLSAIEDPFVIYATPTTVPVSNDLSLKEFRIHNNNIPKADILRALQAFYVAFVVDNKPGVTAGTIRMDSQTPNAGIIDSDTLPDYTSITVLSATQALAAKGFTTISL